MSSTFTPSNAIDMTKEKEWSSALGLLDWDSTNIVFTKRTLIEFLKYTGTTVDTNFGNIQKLPRYAKFGKLSASEEVPIEENKSTGSTTAFSNTDNAADAFKPSRRVRTVPGGNHTDIFSHDADDDALASAPPKPQSAQPPPVAEVPSPVVDDNESGISFSSHPKPSRRVRTNPGGNSSLSNFWDPEETQEAFKPSRRVRQGPGGDDHINGIF